MIPQALRPALRALRHAPDRFLHASRRAALTRRLIESCPRDIGFVCYGNICRSPFAEAAATRAFTVLRASAPRVWSAGLFGPARPAHDWAVHAARERGLDLTPHRSQLLATRDGAATDWVFVMEPWHVRVVRALAGGANIALLGDLDPEAIDTRAIPDPVRQPIEGFRTCYERIDRCVGTLVAVLEGAVQRPGRESPDPPHVAWTARPVT